MGLRILLQLQIHHLFKQSYQTLSSHKRHAPLLRHAAPASSSRLVRSTAFCSMCSRVAKAEPVPPCSTWVCARDTIPLSALERNAGHHWLPIGGCLSVFAG